MTAAAVTFAQDGRVGVITLDRPPANAYDLEVMTQFGAAVEEAVGAGVAAVIVASANPRLFSAGADIARLLQDETAAGMDMIRTSHAAFERMAAAPCVFVAHIAGHALGGGLEIALACDLRYASDGRLRLGLPEISLGLLPGNGGTQRLTRLVGPGRALELLLTGRPLLGEEALALGILNGIFPAAEADAKVRALAERLASGPGPALAAIKRCVYEGGGLALADGLALERALFEELLGSPDAAEGLSASVEGRRPRFGQMADPE